MGDRFYRLVLGRKSPLIKESTMKGRDDFRNNQPLS